MIRIQHAFLVAVMVAGLATAVAAQQSSINQVDIQRLQDNVYDAGSDIQQLRGRDTARANQLQAELDDLRDEVIYLKVKLRKDNTLSRGEYTDVRDRIESVRSRARGEVTRAQPTLAPVTPVPSAGGPPPPPPPAPNTGGSRTGNVRTAGGEVPVGTELDVRLQQSLNSGTAAVEDRFEGTTLVDLMVDGRLLIPAGSVMRGVVTGVEPATRTNRTAKMTVSFDQVTVNGRIYPMRGTVTEAIEGEGIRGEAGRVGTGAGVGAIIGGILGGFKGALAGILIGGGGTIAATEGKQVELPQGSVLRVRIDSPLQVGPSAR